ncbi:DMT family transporter [Alkalihalobacillus sp. AL-G]|uniref:DMT family transporter n=1 Tax=Alkalihalobacillus sp. AL-G TaxID=2926399 RepID=UPI0027294ED7|nr:DMT family transporter [Alkalihalobacillus sp. AL-G]WLD93093.1 DMT family transporter [Alkalihalobacillus sp. AL-G]
MNRYVYGLLVILTTALMGSSFAVGKMGLAYASPLLLAAVRFISAGLIMALIVRILKRTIPRTRGVWFKIMMIGFFQTAGVMGCIFLSLRTITAGESSILTFINPLLVVVFGTIFIRIKYNLYQWTGVFLGFIGVFITMGGQLGFKIGTLLGFLSAVSFAISTLLVKSWGRMVDTWVLSAYQMLFGGLFLLISSFLLEKPFFIVSSDSLVILSWLSIMSSIVQFAVWYYLLQKGDPGKTSSFLFLAPFFGVLSGWLLLEEQLKTYIIIGGLFILIGIFLVNGTTQYNRFKRKRGKNTVVQQYTRL